MKRPNFFILGAPKCGTTSMAAWLGGHPHLFMCPEKEPYFFSTDLMPQMGRAVEEYESLFAGAQDCHSVVGEASAGYLFSRTAVGNILDYCPNPRFLVMLRNPVDMAYALHNEMVYQGDENVTDFQEAWDLQESRERGQSIGRLCRDPQFLQYGAYCRVGEQLDRLYELVPPQRVHVVLLDDIRQSPRREYVSVLDFLDLEDDGRNRFPVQNVSKARRSFLVACSTRVLSTIRTRAGKRYSGLGINRRIRRWNRQTRPRPPLPREARAVLVKYFRDDVMRLSDLLGRDLTDWVADG